MSRISKTAVLCLSAAVLGGCASVSRDGASAGTETERRDAPSAAQPGSPGAPTAAPQAAAMAAGGPGWTDADLAIWRDPAFKRRFAESYLAETEIEPTVTLDERETMLEVLDLIASEKLDEAARIVEKERGPAATAVFDFTLANIRFQQERFDEAAAAYQVAVEKYPKFRRAWGNLGQIRFRQGDFTGAVEALTRVLELGGGDAITYGFLGVGHSKLQHWVSAESAFRMATMLAPETVDWKMGLAESFFRQERFADAVALFDALIAAYPDRADLWLYQGEAYARMNQQLKAAQNFQVVDRLGGATAEMLNNLGDIYANQELYELAVRSYVRAMEMKPDAKIDRPVRAAKYLSGNGAAEETRALVDAIERIHGDRLDEEQKKDLLKLRARVAVAEGAGEDEARILEEIVALDPLDGEALILLGKHAARAGDPEKAIFYYERAAGLEAFEADAKLWHAHVLVNEGRYAEALPLLRRAQTLKPRDHVQDYLEQVERVAQSRSG